LFRADARGAADHQALVQQLFEEGLVVEAGKEVKFIL